MLYPASLPSYLYIGWDTNLASLECKTQRVEKVICEYVQIGMGNCLGRKRSRKWSRRTKLHKKAFNQSFRRCSKQVIKGIETCFHFA